MAAVVIGAGSGSASAVVYTNVTAAAGINYVQNQGFPQGTQGLVMTGGAAAGDFDNDGRVDLYVTRLDAPDILYRNLGNGSFQDVSASAGFTANLPTNGPAWGDIDNDGDLDLYVTSAGDAATVGADRFYMYINDGNGHFTEQAAQRGADIAGVSRFGQSVTFGDYDSDGYLDIHTNDWGNETSVSTSRLLRNLGAANPGHFQDVTAAAGLDVYRPSQFVPSGTNTKAYRFSSTFADMDRDGHPDLVIAGDFQTSQLFWNNGDGTFTDGTTAASVGTGQDAMGLTIGDYDSDGQLDMFVTNLVKIPGQIGGDHSGNRLFQNNGDRTFTDQTDAAGVRDTGWSWGTTFLDYNNNGSQDLAITNGWPFSFDQSRLLQNNNGVFSDISTAAGITDINLQGRGLLSFDYDNDGDLDIFIVNNGAQPILYRNDGGNNNDWLNIKTEGTVSNRDGVGTFITVDPDTTVAGDEMVREIRAGSNFLSQNETGAHFGLGLNAGTVDLITIVWPSGTVQELTNVSVNQLLNLVEAINGDIDGDGFVGLVDLNIVLGNWNQSVPPGNPLADIDGDGFVGLVDLNMVQGNWNVGKPPPAAVPEPGSLAALLLSGVLALSVRRHRATCVCCHSISSY